MTERIPQAQLDAAAKRLCRKVASAIIRAMADADKGYEEIAPIIGMSVKALRSFVNGLIDGKDSDLGMIGMMAEAMDCEVEQAVPSTRGAVSTTSERGRR